MDTVAAGGPPLLPSVLSLTVGFSVAGRGDEAGGEMDTIPVLAVTGGNTVVEDGCGGTHTL